MFYRSVTYRLRSCFVLSLRVQVTNTLLNFIELLCYVLLKDLNLFEVCSCRFFFLFLPYYILLLDDIDIAVVDFEIV